MLSVADDEEGRRHAAACQCTVVAARPAAVNVGRHHIMPFGDFPCASIFVGFINSARQGINEYE